MRRLLVLSLSILFACTSKDPEVIDNDNDAFSTELDCDDNNPDINPNAKEICDGIDNNCDGQVDENVDNVVPWFIDNDGDGFGETGSEPILSCQQPDGYVDNDTDCNDQDDGIHPNMLEICDPDYIDEDCDGQLSEGCSRSYTDCGGPGAMQPGRSLSCSLSSQRVIDRVKVSNGCNDGESGNYTITFDDGSSVNVGARCNTEVSITPRVSRSMTLTMTSGGGGDRNISFTCCGSSGWGVFTK